MKRTYQCRVCQQVKHGRWSRDSERTICMQCAKKTPGPAQNDKYTCVVCNTTRTWNPSRAQTKPTVCRLCGNLPSYKGEPDIDWIESAACRSVDPELFYDLSPSGHYKKICAVCPVIRQCLAAAWRYKDEHAVWGGLNPNQRNRLARSGAAPSSSRPDADIRRCGNCGAWTEPHLFCHTCHKLMIQERLRWIRKQSTN